VECPQFGFDLRGGERDQDGLVPRRVARDQLDLARGQVQDFRQQLEHAAVGLAPLRPGDDAQLERAVVNAEDLVPAGTGFDPQVEQRAAGDLFQVELHALTGSVRWA